MSARDRVDGGTDGLQSRKYWNRDQVLLIDIGNEQTYHGEQGQVGLLSTSEDHRPR